MKRDDEGNFARRMAELRSQAGMSQSELARKMVERGFENYSQMTISRTEKGERPIRLGEARILAEILGSQVDEMTRGAALEDLLDTYEKVRIGLGQSLIKVVQELDEYDHSLNVVADVRSRLGRYDDEAAKEASTNLAMLAFPLDVVAAWAIEVARDPTRDIPTYLEWRDESRLMELWSASYGERQAEG